MRLKQTQRQRGSTAGPDPDPVPALPVFPYLPWSVVDAAGRLGGAASLVGLTWIDSHADSSVPAVTFMTGAQVLVRPRVDTGGVDVTDLLQTRVYG